MTKEALKKVAAELIEGGALQDYMAAQLGVHEAAAAFQSAGNLYWINEDKIAEARGTRDGLRARQVTGDMVVEKSNAFFPVPGYRFSIVLHSDSIDDPRQFQADVELQGVKLTRDPGTTALVWIIPEGAKFGLDLNEELIFRIEVN